MRRHDEGLEARWREKNALEAKLAEMEAEEMRMRPIARPALIGNRAARRREAARLRKSTNGTA